MEKKPLGRPVFSCLAVVLTTVFLGMVLSGCERGNNFRAYEDIPDFAWRHDQPVRFEVDIQDTTTPCNLLIHIRHTGQYPYRNIWIELIEERPAGQRDTSLQEIKLARSDGKWLGRGLGDIIDREMVLRRNFRFSQKGKYTYVLQHAMRRDIVPFLMDVGITVVEND